MGEHNTHCTIHLSHRCDGIGGHVASFSTNRESRWVVHRSQWHFEIRTQDSFFFLVRFFHVQHFCWAWEWELLFAIFLSASMASEIHIKLMREFNRMRSRFGWNYVAKCIGKLSSRIETSAPSTVGWATNESFLFRCFVLKPNLAYVLTNTHIHIARSILRVFFTFAKKKPRLVFDEFTM